MSTDPTYHYYADPQTDLETADCNCRDQGQILAMPKSASQDDILVHTITNDSAWTRTDEVWFGLEVINGDVNYTFLWMDGEPFTQSYSNWHEDQIHQSYQQCNVIMDRGTSMKWAYRRCDLNRTYVCETGQYRTFLRYLDNWS